MNARNTFRIIGYLEGTSALILFFIAMPLKYFYGLPEAVKYTGWAHGLLFMLYVVVLAWLALVARWRFKTIALGLLASLPPFGPFVFEWWLTRTERKLGA